MKILERDDVTESGIHFSEIWSRATSDAIVLVMGYAGSSKTWPRDFIETLARYYRVIIFDNRGTGRSIKLSEPKAYNVKDMSADVDAVVERAGIRSFHLLGYSLGGCIALEYAGTHSARVKTLVLISSTAGGKLYVRPPQQMLDSLENPKGETLWDLYLSTWRHCLSKEGIAKYESILRNIFNSSSQHLTPRSALSGHLHAYKEFDGVLYLKELKMPVLLIAGENDRLTPKSNSEKMVQLIRHSKLILIPKCEHAPHIEAAQEVVNEITSFCKPTK